MKIILSCSFVTAADEKDEKRRRNRQSDKKTDGTGCQPASSPYCCVSSYNSSQGTSFFSFLHQYEVSHWPCHNFNWNFSLRTQFNKTFPLYLFAPLSGDKHDCEYQSVLLQYLKIFNHKTIDAQCCEEGPWKNLPSKSLSHIKTWGNH